MSTKNLSATKALLGILALALFLLSLLLFEVSTTSIFLLTFWFLLFIYGLTKFQSRILFLSFLTVFFIFLMGRIALAEFTEDYPVSFKPAVIEHLTISLLTGLLGLAVGYIALEALKSRRSKKLRPLPDRHLHTNYYRTSIQALSLITFWISLPFLALSYWSDVRMSRVYGYGTIYSGATDTSLLGTLTTQFSMINFVAFVIFLSTIPDQKKTVAPIVAWMLTSGLSLLSGQRAPAMIAALFVLVYLVLAAHVQGKELRFGPKAWISTISAVPVVALLMVRIEKIRGITNVDGDSPSIFSSIHQFLYSQGVSATTITNGFIFSHQLPVQSYLLEFTQSGLIARILGINVIQGNSLERALEKNSFTHSLSYTVLGEDLYLSGRGTGSSFIAEAFYDFGYIGIFSVCLLYGALIAYAQSISSQQIFSNSVKLLIIPDLLWATRGSSTGFLMTLFAPSTILALLIIFGAAHAFRLKSFKSPGTSLTLESSSVTTPTG